jgi:hypothetical protein
VEELHAVERQREVEEQRRAAQDRSVAVVQRVTAATEQKDVDMVGAVAADNGVGDHNDMEFDTGIADELSELWHEGIFSEIQHVAPVRDTGTQEAAAVDAHDKGVELVRITYSGLAATLRGLHTVAAARPMAAVAGLHIAEQDTIKAEEPQIEKGVQQSVAREKQRQLLPRLRLGEAPTTKMFGSLGLPPGTEKQGQLLPRLRLGEAPTTKVFGSLGLPPGTGKQRQLLPRLRLGEAPTTKVFGSLGLPPGVEMVAGAA